MSSLNNLFVGTLQRKKSSMVAWYNVSGTLEVNIHSLWPRNFTSRNSCQEIIRQMDKYLDSNVFIFYHCFIICDKLGKASCVSNRILIKYIMTSSSIEYCVALKQSYICIYIMCISFYMYMFKNTEYAVGH